MEKRINCNESITAFANIPILQYHTIVKHSRKHICDICSKSFVDDETLSKHKIKVHMGINATISQPNEEKNYYCSICSDRGFKSKRQCMEHCAVHHMGKRFQCDQVGCQKILKSSKSFYSKLWIILIDIFIIVLAGMLQFYV